MFPIPRALSVPAPSLVHLFIREKQVIDHSFPRVDLCKRIVGTSWTEKMCLYYPGVNIEKVDPGR